MSIEPFSAQSYQQNPLLECHAKDQLHKHNMAWKELFYNTNILFSITQSTSFWNAMKMTWKLKKCYLPQSYHERLFINIENKIKFQVAKKTRMFIQTHGSTLAGYSWIWSPTTLFFVWCVSLRPSKNSWKLLIPICWINNTRYIAEVMIKYLTKVGPMNVVQIYMKKANVM